VRDTKTDRIGGRGGERGGWGVTGNSGASASSRAFGADGADEAGEGIDHIKDSGINERKSVRGTDSANSPHNKSRMTLLSDKKRGGES